MCGGRNATSMHFPEHELVAVSGIPLDLTVHLGFHRQLDLDLNTLRLTTLAKWGIVAT